MLFTSIDYICLFYLMLLYCIDDEYIGQSSRTFEEQYKEHLKVPSPISENQNITSQTTTLDKIWPGP